VEGLIEILGIAGFIFFSRKHEISPFEVLWPSERLNPQPLALAGARNAVKNVATP
jgi:hypothetical protein